MRGGHPGNQPVTGEPDDTTGPAAGGRPEDDAHPAERSVLRILMLEDDASDAALAQRLLTSVGLAFTAVVVETRASFVQQLTAFRPDVILSDFSLPGFSGENALRVVQEQCPDVPLIFLSGVLGDDAAVELIKLGATDYVLKDRPARLPSVIQRAIAEARQRTQLVQLQAHLHRSQRLASLGRLAAGIAHEFNNQVGVMLNCAEFIRDEAVGKAGPDSGAEGWDSVRQEAEQIERSGKRVIRLVHQLLAAGGQQTTRRELIDLNQVVSGIEELLRSTLGEHIEFRLCRPPQLWPITADAAQIQEVLLNLVRNASEAMPDGGILSIDLKNVTISDREVGRHPELATGDYVCLSARDNGSGMEMETLEHAFEPFFTTKPFVEGGGLGLASVYGIISQAGGTVDISSTPGTGTTITIWLPAPHRATLSDLTSAGTQTDDSADHNRPEPRT